MRRPGGESEGEHRPGTDDVCLEASGIPCLAEVRPVLFPDVMDEKSHVLREGVPDFRGGLPIVVAPPVMIDVPGCSREESLALVGGARLEGQGHPDEPFRIVDAPYL